ncbi:hypothetical protein AURDEDRAFT_169197 [Auricularia subglabra TFB-10046 SS5]|nr:hypothetical protein AURDEDRAFT_169197 [Auricularia subglabra TFB-10046 SS5]
MSPRYVCAVTGHSPALVFDINIANLHGCTRASVQDVLEYSAEHHYVECGCNLKIGGRVWLSSTPFGDAGNFGDIMSDDPLAIDAVLDELCGASEPSTLYFVISGDKTPCKDYFRLHREKIFASYIVRDAQVFVRAGGLPSLPPQTPCSFDTVCSTPGTTFVDKSKSLHAILRLLSSRMNIIRRPKGFGKTTFLSMFEAFLDPLSGHIHWPFTFPERQWDPIFPKQGGLLVFSLDLADLAFTSAMNTRALEAECKRLMDAAARKFYARYRDLLHVPEQEPSHASFSPTLLDVVDWARLQDWLVCCTIDNYTAPILDRPNTYYAWVLNQEIFQPLDWLYLSGSIPYGLIVGEDVPHASSCLNLPACFIDVSDKPELYDAIGFTLDEVLALGDALSADLIAALPSGTPTGRYARRVYAARDIVAVARAVTSAQSPSEPTPTEVRTVKFKHPPPAAPVVSFEMTPEEYAEEERLIDADVANHFGPLSNDEEEDDEAAHPPEMTDASSNSSLDTSFDGLPSAPSSGQRGKPLPVVTDEPSSPLDG